MKIQPLADRVLVKPHEERGGEKNGIVIPDTAKEKPQEADVLAVGTGKLDDGGKKIPFTVKVGDQVLMPKYGGTDVELDGIKYKVIREDDLLGIIK